MTRSDIANETGGAPALPPKRLVLWPDGAPGAVGTEPADVPTLTVFPPPPKTATGAAIVICPGGGYSQHSTFECEPVAAWLNRLGITACLLRYRIGPRYQHPAPLQDVARAMKMTRALAGQWRVDPGRIGIIGFSAGGHLASTVCTRFTDGDRSAADVLDRFSSRPDVAILVYPVITMLDPNSNVHSRKYLLGDNPPAELLEYLSNDRHVTRRTPPTFLFHTMDDAAVSVENSLQYVVACRRNGVPVETHLYEKGVHGVGFAEQDPALNTWPLLASRWLAARGFGNGG